MSDSAIVPDSEHKGLVARLPQPFRDLAILARFDRPIGWWLLFWPCAWGVWLTGAGPQWQLVLWLLAGSIAMRGAGCVYNDIVDADLDRQVARTAQRPVASGRISAKAAWAWLLGLCLVGLIVLLQLRMQAQIVALVSLLLVAVYPFMKRLTWWPQAWLGLVFTWGAPVGWIALRSDRLDVLAVTISHMRAMAQQVAGSGSGAARGGETLLTAGIRRDPARFPEFSRAVAEAATEGGADNGLSFGLECIFDGVAARVEASAGDATPA